MRTVLFLILLSFFSAAQSQHQYSLAELQDSALKRNADLRQLRLEIDKARHQNRALNGLGNTTVNYTFGQIDGPDQDYQWQITQPIGNPLAGITNTQLRRASITSQQLNYELNKEWVKMQVEQAYAGWQGWHRIEEVRSEIKAAYVSALEVAEKQLARGEISKVALGFIQGRLMEAIQEENQALQQKLNQAYILELLTRLSLEDSQPEKLELPLLDDVNASDSGLLYDEYYRSKVALAEEQLQNRNSRLFPSFSVGYFNQQLQGIEGYDGFMVGARVPLFNLSNYQSRQLSKISLEQSNLETQQRIWERNSRMRQLKLQRKQLFSQLSDLRLTEGETDRNIATVRKSYTLGEIDMLVLSNSLSALGAAEINQQKLLIRLHQLQAELNYLNTTL